jgi:murein DD-endopeptidase MepM/ murein hydrolase activator NlpD
MHELLSPAAFGLPGPRPLDGPPAQADPGRVRELAHEFESMLLLQMLRQLRQTMKMMPDEEQDGFGYGADTMMDTMDAELARQLSAAGGMGVSDVIANAILDQRAGVVAPASTTLPPGATERRAPAAAAAYQRAAVDAVLATPQPPAAIPVGLPVGAAAAAPPTVSAGEAHAIPLPLDAPVTSPFGWRRDPLHGRTRHHRGVDLRAAYGTEVPAPAAGRVVSVGDHGGYGLSIVVEHRPGVQTRYAHLSAALVQPGQPIAAGQPIGRVGTSGRSTAPHLHFEVIEDGRRVDPAATADRLFAQAAFKPAGAVADSPSGGDSAPATEE